MLRHRRDGRPTPRWGGRIAGLAAAALVLTLTSVGAGSGGAAAEPVTGADAGPSWDASPTPYLGWSSWSMQATTRPGVNPQGSYSWLTEDHVLAQADVMASRLAAYGYRYINLDAGWWRTWDWTPVYDEHGRPAVWAPRIPDGMAAVVQAIHAKGLKVGIYLPAGMETGKEGDNTTGQDLTETIEGAPQCTLADAIYPDHRLTNGWQSAYQLDFEAGNGCAAAYVDSLVDLFQSWGGVDLLKLDGIGPGSGHNDITGSNSRYDNRADLAEFDKAFQATGHHVEIQVSWNVSQQYASDWQTYADSWRTSNDVECYCSTLTTWNSVSQRLDNALSWAPYAGPDTGWSNLDSLEIGNGDLDGLTQTERQTAMGIWSMAAAPLYLGDDLTQLDDYGFSLATNRDVLAVDQDPLGATLTKVSGNGSQYVVARRLSDGDLAVGVFNLANTAASVSTTVQDVAAATGADLPRRPAYELTDLWSHRTTQTTGEISTPVPAHGSVLYRVSARPGSVSSDPSAALSVGADPATLAPGDSTAVTATLTNTSAIAETGVELDVTAPVGWTVSRTGGAVASTLAPGASTSAEFSVTAPAAAAPIASASLTATAIWSGHGTSGTTSATADVMVVSPVSAPLRTANTTGSPAAFGELGNRLAISAAGTNVGPAGGGPGGGTAAADGYGAIYQPGSLGGAGTVQATVTQQAGGSAAKAGIMVRNDMTGSGTPVGVALFVSNGRVSLVYNNAGGGTTYTTRTGTASAAYPVTLRLVRTGSSYAAAYSTNGGSTWTALTTVTAGGQAAVQDAGVFQSAGSATTPATASYSDLSVS